MSYIYPIHSNHTTKYQVYFMHHSTKIYIGVFSSLEQAELISHEVCSLMENKSGIPNFIDYNLNYKKIVSLCNLRDHGTYIKNPIYLHSNYFNYYVTKEIVLTFDLKDLFYFSTYKISKRGGYLYIQDHISQQSILSRFGIKPYSVLGKDYDFKNGNPYDFRRSNLMIVNAYCGVSKRVHHNITTYISKIYTDKNIVLGHYSSEIEAAIAYNKAIDLLIQNGSEKNYIPNVIPYLTEIEYQEIYNKINLSPRLLTPNAKRKKVVSSKKYRGIYKAKTSFKACIGFKGKQIYLGMYPTEKRAAQAYNFASFYLFGANGYINTVTPVVEDRDAEKIAHHLSRMGIKKDPYSHS